MWKLIAIRRGGRPRSHKAFILEHAPLTTTVREAKEKPPFWAVFL